MEAKMEGKKPDVGNSVPTVTIPREELEALVGAFRQIRTGFLLCAPAYAAGSRGEALVRMAEASGDVITSLERKICGKSQEH